MEGRRVRKREERQGDRKNGKKGREVRQRKERQGSEAEERKVVK
jgi:hypothetical protein